MRTTHAPRTSARLTHTWSMRDIGVSLVIVLGHPAPPSRVGVTEPGCRARNMKSPAGALKSPPRITGMASISAGAGDAGHRLHLLLPVRLPQPSLHTSGSQMRVRRMAAAAAYTQRAGPAWTVRGRHDVRGADEYLLSLLDGQRRNLPGENRRILPTMALPPIACGHKRGGRSTAAGASCSSTMSGSQAKLSAAAWVSPPAQLSVTTRIDLAASGRSPGRTLCEHPRQGNRSW